MLSQVLYIIFNMKFHIAYLVFVRLMELFVAYMKCCCLFCRLISLGLCLGIHLSFASIINPRYLSFSMGMFFTINLSSFLGCLFENVKHLVLKGQSDIIKICAS